MRFTATLCLLLLPVVAVAQQRTVPRSCLPDSDVHIELVGTVHVDTYVLPGDSTRHTSWYFEPNAWACQPVPGDTIGIYTQEEIMRFQVILPEPEFPALQQYRGQVIVMKGMLRSGDPGLHSTPFVFVPDRPLRITRRDN